MFADENLSFADIEENIEDENDEEGAIAIQPYEVDCLPNDYNISTLLNLLQRGYLRIPSFQRNYVWEKDMASKFIESVIIGLPIPQLFFFEQGRNRFLIIDGQQRFVSLYLFKSKRFPKNNTGRAIIRKYLSEGKEIPPEELSGEHFVDFALKLPSDTQNPNALNTKNYDTLPEDEKFDFKGSFDFNRTIRTITIRQNGPDDGDSSMFEIFSRLNSGGVTLKPQEIRMSLFYSEFYDKILDFNGNSNWRKFFGKAEHDLHMSDVEILVRAFAMLKTHEQYASNMKVFLNKFSKLAMKYDEAMITGLANLFEDFWSACRDLPVNVFKNEKGQFVVSLFEAVFVAACESIQRDGLQNRGISLESVSSLKKDKEFSDAYSLRTTHAKAVSTRLKKAREFIQLV